jgi:hypothetical protein
MTLFTITSIKVTGYKVVWFVHVNPDGVLVQEVVEFTHQDGPPFLDQLKCLKENVLLLSIIWQQCQICTWHFGLE